ncbi:WXG100 family type VII secretion target [Glycomyces paridis]|uniref:PPE domain-containing protein n=1 Tax=Glycomyces paridis TaxID=2126555 RepID=A0A4S8NX22_9ACTN|nr:hypothetical protein [Glycomyces paridis]THV22038.1 hypothetical protein E9998_23750 [Glycomyces paridis]
MVAKGKGEDFYKSSYTHEQLWDMLHAGNDWAVERAGSIWTSAASGMKAAREELDTHVSTLRTQWTGAASEEFESRMNVIKQYSVESENGMKSVGELKIPNLANSLRTAQTNSESLNPAYLETDYDDWVESKKNVPSSDPEAVSKKPQWEQEWLNELDSKHQELAKIVADLGDVYAQAKETDFGEPPPPPPSDLPGNSSYQPPTGGVFADGTLTTPGYVGGNGPGAPGSVAGDTNGDGLVNSDDLDPVDNSWNPGSYGDIDSDIGGLASATGYTPTGGGPGMGSPSFGGSSSLTGASTGLFGPAAGSAAGSAPGRGGSTTSPARAGATNTKPGGTNGARSGSSGSSGRGGNQGRGLSSSSRSAIRGGSGNNPRGGTRSGYADDDDDDTYTRETWLREDDVEWGRNNVAQEELDDED